MSMKNISFVYIIIGVVVLGALFFILKPQTQTSPSGPATTQQAGSSPTESQAPFKTFELILKDKKIISGNEVIRVNKGDEVLFKVTADRGGEIHLHGYDQDLDLEQDTTGELRVTANLTGRFDIEFHESETNKYEIGALEVQPK